MPYIGKDPGTGLRGRFIYTATAGQTTFSGSDSLGRTLTYTDSEYTDVYLNGVKLDKADYTATSGTSIVLDSGATAGDILEVLAFDTFGLFSGDFAQDVTVAGDLTVSGTTTTAATTMTGDLSLADKIVHTGDTNTAIRFADADTVTVETGGSERMRVTSTGNIQIGSTNSGAAGSLDVSIGSTSTTGGITLFSPTDGTHSIGFADGTSGTDRYRGYVEYKHADDALCFATQSSERMRIDSSGSLLIGTTNANPVVNNVAGMLFVGSTGAGQFSRTDGVALFLNRGNNGIIEQFHRAGTAVGFISVTTTATSYSTSSDHRLKENVVDLTGAIDRVKTLAPKRFNFLADPDTTVDGFLAHEVTAVPEAIVGTHNQVDDDGNPVYQGIDQSKLVPLLTAALQEAIAKIETLETKVAALEAE